MKTRAHVIFRGRVQGVFFRDNTRKKARELGVFGWVRNLPDGDVEAVFEGEPEPVRSVVDWCRNHQPYANVTDAKVSLEEFRGEFEGFEILR